MLKSKSLPNGIIPSATNLPLFIRSGYDLSEPVGCDQGQYKYRRDYSRLSKDYTSVDFSFMDALSKMIRVIDMHRVSDIFGPFIYTHFGQPNADLSVDYDSQQGAYNAFFKDLDTAVTLLKPFVTGSKNVLSGGVS